MSAPPRISQYREAGLSPPFPDIPDGGSYLIHAMLTLSPVRPMAMGGFRPADWPEIFPFMQATGLIAEPWEAQALHQMCRSYCAGWNAGHVAAARSPMEIKEREETSR
jgi:hypothetical protein